MCCVMKWPKEWNSVKPNSTSMACGWDCSWDMTLWSWALAVAVTNSITLWNEQPVLVGRKRPRVRGIFRSRNVSHFHESWRYCVIVGRLSMSVWFVCLTPQLLLLLPLLFNLDCNFFPLHSPQKLFVSVWVGSISLQHVQKKFLKRKQNQNSFLWSLQCRSTVN